MPSSACAAPTLISCAENPPSYALSPTIPKKSSCYRSPNLNTCFQKEKPAATDNTKSIYTSNTTHRFTLPDTANYSIDRYQGLSGLRRLPPTKTAPTNLSHAGVQSLLGKIGLHYRYNLWFPRNDLGQIDQSVISTGKLLDRLPEIGREINPIMEQIDCHLAGRRQPRLPVRSRTHHHDIFRPAPSLRHHAGPGKAHDFRVVARKMREEKFYREIHRPTFRKHRLEEKVSFMSYDDAWHWLERTGRPLTPRSSVQTPATALKLHRLLLHPFRPRLLHAQPPASPHNRESPA